MTQNRFQRARRLPVATTVVVVALLMVGCAGEDADRPDRSSTTAASSNPSVPIDDATFDRISAETILEPNSDQPIGPQARAEADALYDAVVDAAATRPWGRAASVGDAGFVQMPGDPIHWYNPESIARGGPVDPESPHFVMIQDDQVIGVMYLAPSADGTIGPPPAPGSPLVRWHLHRWTEPVCLGVEGLVVTDLPDPEGACPTGAQAASNSPWMFHVWLVGSDRFADEMHPADHDH